MGSLIVESIPGGYTVTEADDANRWWSVAWRGAEPLIASHLCERIDPHSGAGRKILAAIRETLRAGSR